MPSKYSPTSTIYMTPFLEAESLKATGPQVYELELANTVTPLAGTPPPVAVTMGNSIVYFRGAISILTGGALVPFFTFPEEIAIEQDTYGSMISATGGIGGSKVHSTWFMTGNTLAPVLGPTANNVYFLDSIYFFTSTGS